jgi:hypothetical protein
MSGAVREQYLRAHADPYQPEFWRRTQWRIAAGEVLEVLPYVPPELVGGADVSPGAAVEEAAATPLASG